MLGQLNGWEKAILRSLDWEDTYHESGRLQSAKKPSDSKGSTRQFSTCSKGRSIDFPQLDLIGPFAGNMGRTAFAPPRQQTTSRRISAAPSKATARSNAGRAARTFLRLALW